MRVLIVNPEFYVYGGAERLIVRLGNYLTDHGVANALMTPGLPARIKREFTETRLIETDKIEQLPPVLHSVAHRYDVINPHNDPAQICVYPRVRPTVWMCNEPPIQVLTGGSLDERQKRIVRNHVDTAVVADEFNRHRFMDIYGYEPRTNHYGVEYEFFASGDPDAVIGKYGLADRFVVLQVGMFTFTKNQVAAVGAFKKIKKEIPEAKLVLAGFNNTPYRRQVEQRIRSSGLARDVVLTGEIPQTEVRDLYHASDVLLVPIDTLRAEIGRGHFCNSMTALALYWFQRLDREDGKRGTDRIRTGA